MFRHKYTLFISTDGNYRLQRKNKKDDPEDVALNAGNSYFADVGPYREYLRHVNPSKDVRSNYKSFFQSLESKLLL